MLLIRNGLVYPMDGSGPAKADILVDGGRILRVEERIDPDTARPERVIEAAGLRVCPGLIDAHTHLPCSEGRGEADERALADDALRAGVTTFAIWPEADGGQLKVYHGHEAASPRRIIRCWTAAGHSEAQLRAALAEAASSGQAAAVHLHEEAEARLVLRLKAETGAEVILVHAAGCEAALMDIARAGCGVVTGACCRRGRGSAYALAARLRQAGATVALTCDFPATRLHHLPLGAGLCVRAGLAETDALRAITSDAARLLGVERDCGAIRPGMRADFTLFDGDPLMLASAQVLTVCAGRVTGE